MVKKLKVFQAIEDLVAKPVELYTGPVRKIYGDEFALNKRGDLFYKKQDVKVKSQATFYKSEGKYINIDNNCVLPTREEAIDHCTREVNKKKQDLLKMLRNPSQDAKALHLFTDKIKYDSTCLYFDESELKYSQSMPGKEFKQLIKNREANSNKKK